MVPHSRLSSTLRQSILQSIACWQWRWWIYFDYLRFLAISAFRFVFDRISFGFFFLLRWLQFCFRFLVIKVVDEINFVVVNISFAQLQHRAQLDGAAWATLYWGIIIWLKYFHVPFPGWRACWWAIVEACYCGFKVSVTFLCLLAVTCIAYSVFVLACLMLFQCLMVFEWLLYN